MKNVLYIYTYLHIKTEIYKWYSILKTEKSFYIFKNIKVSSNTSSLSEPGYHPMQYLYLGFQFLNINETFVLQRDNLIIFRNLYLILKD